MINEKIRLAIRQILAFSAAGSLMMNAMAASKTADEPAMEKCYGIVKAGMNDCETSSSSCSGSAVKDNQPDAFVFVPKGLCNKIVGGSLVVKK